MILRRLARAAGAAPDEEALTASAGLVAFLVMTALYALRPVRDAIGAGDAGLSGLVLMTLGATAVLVPALLAMTVRRPRRELVPIALRSFAFVLVALAAALRLAPSHATVAAFFVASSALNLLAVSLVWGLFADAFARGAAGRLFGAVAAAGTLGAMTGSFATGALVKVTGPFVLVGVTALLLELAARASRRVPARTALTTDDDGSAPSSTRPLLLAAAGYVVLFTFTSTIAYLEQARILRSALADTASRAALLARIDLAVSALSLVAQLVGTSRVIAAVGTRGALVALPLATGVGLAVLLVHPTLAYLVVFQTLRRTLDYALAKPAREMLFTTATVRARFDGKALVDTLVYRGGDALAAAAWGSVASFAGQGAVAISACVVWAGVALALVRASDDVAPS